MFAAFTPKVRTYRTRQCRLFHASFDMGLRLWPRRYLGGQSGLWLAVAPWFSGKAEHVRLEIPGFLGFCDGWPFAHSWGMYWRGSIQWLVSLHGQSGWDTSLKLTGLDSNSVTAPYLHLKGVESVWCANPKPLLSAARVLTRNASDPPSGHPQKEGGLPAVWLETRPFGQHFSVFGQVHTHASSKNNRIIAF